VQAGVSQRSRWTNASPSSSKPFIGMVAATRGFARESSRLGISRC